MTLICQNQLILMLVCISTLLTRGFGIVFKNYQPPNQQTIRWQNNYVRDNLQDKEELFWTANHGHTQKIIQNNTDIHNYHSVSNNTFMKLSEELRVKRAINAGKSINKPTNFHFSNKTLRPLDVTSYTFNGDYHTTAVISWTHKDCKVMFILTCDSSITKNGHSVCQSKSNLYRSINYGESYDLENHKFQNSSKSWISAVTVSPIDRDIVIVTDIENQMIYYSNNEGETFNVVEVPFKPEVINFHPVLKNYILAYDKSSKYLYVTETCGQTWVLVHRNAKKYFWAQNGVDVDLTTIFLEIDTHSELFATNKNVSLIFTSKKPYGGQMTILDKNLGPVYPDSLYIEKEYIIVQRHMSTGDSKLYVSYKRQFPFKECHFLNLNSQLHYFVIDASHGEIALAVLHQGHTNLYISDKEGLHFSLTLNNVASSDRLSWSSGRPVVDVHKVAGLQGTYIANEKIKGTLISYDKGGRWFPLQAPTYDINGKPTNCKLPRCSLHLKLYFGRFYVGISSILSKTTAPGLIIAEGFIGTKPQISGLTSGGVYLSNDGGKSWQQVLQGIYAYTFADQGGIVSAVPLYRWVHHEGSIKYSCTEGNDWQSTTISENPVVLIAMLTQSSAKSDVVSVFGRNWKSTTFTVWKVNFSSVFYSKCEPNDYTLWSPTDIESSNNCLLGEHYVYEKRKQNICCYNGLDYERPINITNCNCTMADFICDFNYYRKEPTNICFPSSSGFHRPPPNCPEGGSYIKSRGYKKVIGNKCTGEIENDLKPLQVPCPPQAPVDLSISANKHSVSIGEKVEFTLLQRKGFLHTKYSWNFGDNKTTESNISTFEKARHREYEYKTHGEYSVSVVAANQAGSYTVKTFILVIDKVSHAFLHVPKTVIDGELAIYTVTLDRPGHVSKQEHGFLHFVWIFQPGSTPVLSLNSSVKHRYQKPGIYEIEVQVFNAISIGSATAIVHVHQDIRILKLEFSMILDLYNKHTVKWRSLFGTIVKNFLIEKFRIEKEMIDVSISLNIPTVAMVSLVQDNEPNKKVSHYYEYTIDDIKNSIVETINSKQPSIFLAGKEIRILFASIVRDKKVQIKSVVDTSKKTLMLVVSIPGTILLLGILFVVIRYIYRAYKARESHPYQNLLVNSDQGVQEFGTLEFGSNIDTTGTSL